LSSKQPCTIRTICFSPARQLGKAPRHFPHPSLDGGVCPVPTYRTGQVDQARGVAEPRPGFICPPLQKAPLAGRRALYEGIQSRGTAAGAAIFAYFLINIFPVCSFAAGASTIAQLCWLAASKRDHGGLLASSSRLGLLILRYYLVVRRRKANGREEYAVRRSVWRRCPANGRPRLAGWAPRGCAPLR